jgi:hypothetical protein
VKAASTHTTTTVTTTDTAATSNNPPLTKPGGPGTPRNPDYISPHVLFNVLIVIFASSIVGGYANHLPTINDHLSKVARGQACIALIAPGVGRARVANKIRERLADAIYKYTKSLMKPTYNNTPA